jgi:hypothetical protein
MIDSHVKGFKVLKLFLYLFIIFQPINIFYKIIKFNKFFFYKIFYNVSINNFYNLNYKNY